MLNCPRCGADYSEQGLDNGRCRGCGHVISWSMTAVPAQVFSEPPRRPGPADANLDQPPAAASPAGDDPAPAAGGPAHSGATRAPLPASAGPDDGTLEGYDPPDTGGEASSGGSPWGEGTVDDDIDATIHSDDLGRGEAAPVAARESSTTPLVGDVETGSPLDDIETRATVEANWAEQLQAQQQNSHTLKGRAEAGTVPDHLVIPRRAVRTVAEQDGGRQDYELIEVIGRGAEGVVHAARQASIDRTVALKMIRQQRATEGGAKQKFLSEAVVTGALEHPNIVPIYDLGTTNDGSLFYVMKRIRGTPWSEVIGRNTLPENLTILMRTADAVGFAHSRGVVHRDIKPENVMLGDFGEVLLTDWGIAMCTDQFVKKRSVATSRGLGGTPAYMAPEMATGPIERLGPAADIYLLGAILYEIVTGKPPHHADSVMACLVAAAKNQIQPTEVKNELVDIARRAMLTNPKARYESVREFQDAIAAYLSHSESLLLSDQAEADLKRARQSSSYDDYTAAVFGFQKALELWPQNRAADKSLVAARADYAAAALAKGDLDLALSMLDPQRVRHNNVRKRVLAAQRERDARKHRLQNMRRLAAGLLVAIFVGGSFALWKVDAAKRDAIAARELARSNATAAERNADDALKQKEEADKQRKLARQRENDARRSAEQAMQQRQRAELARQQAVDALRRAGEAAYASAISLATNNIAGGAFSDAISILRSQQAQPEQAVLRHWEWGRLMYLCLGGDPASPQGAAVQSLEVDAEVTGVAAAAGGELIAAATLAGSIHLYRRDGDADRPVWTVDRVIDAEVTVHAIAMSPSGDRLAAAGDDGVIRVYDPADAEGQPQRLHGHRRAVQALAFSPSSEALLLASASADRTIKLWDLQSDEPLQTLVGHTATVWAVDFSPQGDRLVSASDDFTARIWGVQSGREYQRFRQHDEPVFCARFSPDGRWVASGGYDKRVLLWRAERDSPVEETLVQQVIERLSGESEPANDHTVARLIGHSDSIRDLRFSADGQRLVSGARDNTLRIWDVSELEQAARQRDEAAGESLRADTAPRRLLKTLRGHGGWISECRFIDPRRIVSGAYDRQLRIWDPEAYAENLPLDGLTRPVLCSAFAPDGRSLALAFDDGTAGVWDTASGQRTGRLEEGHQFLVSAAAFLPENRLATVAGDDSLRLWDVDTGTEIWAAQGSGRRGLLALSPDGQRILTGSSDGKTARIWEAASGRLLGSLGQQRLEQLQDQYPDADDEQLDALLPDITAVGFSVDGELMISGETSGAWHLWRFGRREPLVSVRGHDRPVTALAVMPDGQRLLSASADGSVAFWDLHSGQELPGQRLRHEDAVSMLAVSADGQAALTVAADGRGAQRLYHWNLNERALQAACPPLHRQLGGDEALSINSVAFSPDQSEAMVSTFDRRNSRYAVHRWDLRSETLQPAGDRGLRAGQVLSAVYARATAQQILTVGGSGARFWRRADNRELMNYQPHGEVVSIDFSPDGQRIVTSGADRSIKLWQRDEAGRWLARSKLIEGHRGAIHAARFGQLADQQVILSCGDDGQLLLWSRDGDRWQPQLRMQGSASPLRSGVVSPDGKLAASGSDDGTIRLWDLASGQQTGQWPAHAAAVLDLAFSADGSRLLSGGGDNRGMIWEIPDGRLIKRLLGHSAAVNAVDFSPDGWRALTGSQDNTIKLWDTEVQPGREAVEGTELLNLSGHQREVTTVAFSPDGKQIASGARDAQAILRNSVDLAPAIRPSSARRVVRPGDATVQLLPQPRLVYPTGWSVAGWRIELALLAGTSGEPLAGGGRLELDAALAERFGWTLAEEGVRGGGAEAAPLLARLSRSEVADRVTLELTDQGTLQTVQRLLQLVRWRSQPSTGKVATPDGDEQAIALRLYRPGAQSPQSVQTLSLIVQHGAD